MLRKLFIPVLLSAAFALVMAGCGGTENTSTTTTNTAGDNKATTTTTPTTPTTTTTTTPATTTSPTTTAGGDKIGVPECDDFIAKYEACVTAKVPPAARAAFQQSLSQWRSAWRQAASTPQGKAGLAMGCKAASDQSKTSMKPYGCDF